MSESKTKDLSETASGRSPTKSPESRLNVDTDPLVEAVLQLLRDRLDHSGPTAGYEELIRRIEESYIR